jgi:hypothetical protein
MDTDNPVLAKWNDLKDLVEALELDAHKNAKGVCAAGVRLRKGLRELKSKSADLVKTTVERDKVRKSKD